MRILIAYDGSAPADAALQDLRRAGLPKRGEALVISVADVLLPPSDNEGVDNTLPTYLPPAVRRAQERAARAVEEAAKFAERASKQISSDFPEWRVQYEAFADSPAWAVIRKADEWKPDLVVVGSHGQPALAGRLILGSVSQRILYEVRCSVRVGRRRTEVDDSPIRLVIGLDGSPNSQAALRAVSLREWPARTEIRVVAAVDTVMAVTPDPARPSEEKWIEVDDEHPSGQIHQVFEASAAQLRSAGLNTSVVIKKGNPKDVLLKEAESCGADCIFVGAKGIRGIDRLLLGSVSAAVAARAQCSVEVVRPLTIPATLRSINRLGVQNALRYKLASVLPEQLLHRFNS